jgi:hypothetical protein
LESPLYDARTLWSPTPKDEVTKVPAPVLGSNAIVPNREDPLANVSVSVMVPVASWLAVKLTPAVKVTGTPSTAGFGAELRIVTLAVGAAEAGGTRAPGRSSRTKIPRMLPHGMQVLEFI